MRQHLRNIRRFGHALPSVELVADRIPAELPAVDMVTEETPAMAKRTKRPPLDGPRTAEKKDKG